MESSRPIHPQKSMFHTSRAQQTARQQIQAHELAQSLRNQAETIRGPLAIGCCCPPTAQDGGEEDEMTP